MHPSHSQSRIDSTKDNEKPCDKVYSWFHKMTLIIYRFNLVCSSVG